MEAVERYALSNDIEDINDAIRQHCSTGELAYITVQERGSGKQEDDNLGRYTIEYPNGRPGNASEEDDLLGTLSPDAFALGDAAGYGPDDLALNWLRGELIRHMTGAKSVRFRIKLMAAKGHKQLKSATVMVIDNDWDTGSRVPTAPLPGISKDRQEMAAIAQAGEVRERLDSHDFTRRGIAYILEGVANITEIQKVQGAAFKGLYETLQDNAKASDVRANEALELARTVINDRSKADADRIAAEANRDVTERTVTAVLDRVSEAVNLGMTAKYGMSPEMIEVGKALSSNPKMRQLFADPRILEIVRDEGMQNFLGDVLESTAREKELEAQKQKQLVGQQAAQKADEGEGATPTDGEPTNAPKEPEGEGEASPPPSTGDASQSAAVIHTIPPVPHGFMEQDNA